MGGQPRAPGRSVLGLLGKALTLPKQRAAMGA